MAVVRVLLMSCYAALMVYGRIEVKVGALLTANSAIGRSVKPALLAAVDDINSDKTILQGTNFNLILRDTNGSGFLGTIQALELLTQEVVAVIGPQSSGIAHIVSNVVNELHVPLISFGATDPTLSASQYTYFLRATTSDYYQMHAIADIVRYYNWRDVIAIYGDDDYGRNSIPILGDALSDTHTRISYKAVLSPGASRSSIREVLTTVKVMESRVYVVHVNPESGLSLFSIAKRLGMMGSGYVWIASDWLPSVLDLSESVDLKTLDVIQGVVALRHHTPDSDLKRRFSKRWNELKDIETPRFNSYALYAYDSVWLLAHALDVFLREGENMSFSEVPGIKHLNGNKLPLDTLYVFDQGERLRKLLFEVNFTGVSGQIHFTSHKNIVNPSFEILNFDRNGTKPIGYWSNSSRLSTIEPEMLSSIVDHKLETVTWPGETTEQPRGWVFPDGRLLQIAVPFRVNYKEFASADNGTSGVKGFCIDVFEAALKLLPYDVPHEYVLYGDGLRNPSYSDLVYDVSQNKYDVAIGDITITPNRTRAVSFTQPYTESGLVVVIPVKQSNTSPWVFLEPFTWQLWSVVGAFFLLLGLVIWLLEHRRNEEFHGSPKEQIITILWFSLSTMFFAQRENTVTTLGRVILSLWLFVVLIVNSSYTASLTSIITVQHLSPGLQGINSLVSSTDPIGVQDGSFAYNYLVQELDIAPSRLKIMRSQEDYINALQRGVKGGGVAAIVDEHLYVELLLAQTHCTFTTVGEIFTKSGWGFALQKDSLLGPDLSIAILQLSESGELQKIQDMWLASKDCPPGQSEGGQIKLSVESFGGLFVMCGIACFLALVSFFWKVLFQYMRYIESDCKDDLEKSQPERDGSKRPAAKRSIHVANLKGLIKFADRKEAEIEAVIKQKNVDQKHGQPPKS